jgi:zinc transporter ZupT
MKFSRIILLSVFATLIILSYVYSHGSHGHGKNKNKNKSNGETHSHNHGHSHGHDHHHHEEKHSHEEINPKDLKFNSLSEIQKALSFYYSYYNRLAITYLNEKLFRFSKKEQAYFGAFICSSAPIPIFILIILFNIKNVKLLDTMSAFASGALLGDVIMHNLPEIFESDSGSESHSNSGSQDSFFGGFFTFFKQKEALICVGVIVLFAIEKIIAHFLHAGKKQVNDTDRKESGEHEAHGHHGHAHFSDSTKNIIIALIGDCVHNITDGLAIGAAYSKSKKN